MNKKISAARILASIFKSIFKCTPISSFFTIVNYASAAAMPAVATLVSVKLFDNAYRLINGENTRDDLFFYAFLYLITYLINDLLYFASSISINAGVYEKGTSMFRIHLYEKMANLPLIAFENAETLNQKERAEKAVNDETLSSLFNRSLIFLRSTVSIISVVAILAGFSLWLVPVSLLSVLPYLFAKLIRGKEFYHVKRAQAKKTRLLSYLWTLFNGRQSAKEMRVMGFDSYITNRWASVRDEVNEELWSINVKDNKSLLLCDAIRILGYGVSIAIVLMLVVSGAISIGVFGASITAFLSVQGSMKEFLIDFGRLPEQIGYARDYYEFLNIPEEQNGNLPYPGLKSEIVLNGVSFAYPNAENLALKNIHLTIRKGEKIAILGENGCGKTTLSKLILGLYPAQTGTVQYDGSNVSAFTKESLYPTISAVAQNFVSYNLTLRENIAISDVVHLTDDASIEKSIADVGLKSILVDTGGLDGELGPVFGGAELSGGQWQKLAIARGLFKKSEFIILDEPTSALDPFIETEILSKFIEIAKDKTAVIISHRVGLCKLVDKIVVMRQGEIVETGTHRDLMAAGGEYHRLYTAQEQWYV